MQNNWETYELGDFAKNVSRRFDFRTYKEVVFVNTSDVLEGKFLTSKLQTSGNLPGQAKKAICKGDLLFSEIRPNNKRFAKVDFDASNYVVSTKFMVIVTDDKIVDKEFFYHVIKSYERLEELQSIAESRSGTFPQITFEAISNVQFSLPPLNEQRAIASILSALDDKIELNLQMNKTLEEMSMTLYKHWFIDFGPFKEGKFVESELGMIPDGWEVRKLGLFAKVVMGQSPKSEFYNLEGAGIPFHQGVKDFGVRFPTDTTYTTSGNKIAEPGEILFSVRAPVGRINVAKNRIVLGRGLASISMKEGNEFLIYALKNFFQKEDIIGSGTVFNSVNKTEIENLSFVIPEKSILSEFISLITELDQLILANYNEIQNLKNQRDSLLPKLINGEISIKSKDF